MLESTAEEDKLIKCSTCCNTITVFIINGKKLKSCKTCWGSKIKRSTLSEEKHQLPAYEEPPGFMSPVTSGLINIVYYCNKVFSLLCET